MSEKPGEMKPLFIPLRTRWWNAFECGAKDIEYRRVSGRFNARTCLVGRYVTLSHGYSGDRLHGVITGCEILRGADVPDIVREIYDDPDPEIIAIRVRLKPSPAPVRGPRI